MSQNKSLQSVKNGPLFICYFFLVINDGDNWINIGQSTHNLFTEDLGEVAKKVLFLSENGPGGTVMSSWIALKWHNGIKTTF